MVEEQLHTAPTGLVVLILTTFIKRDYYHKLQFIHITVHSTEQYL